MSPLVPVAAQVWWSRLDPRELLEGLDSGPGVALAYLTVLLLVAGDGVIPVLPGESTIAVAGALASRSELRLVLVMLVAAGGAVLGDSITYSVGRLGSGRIHRALSRFFSAERISRAEAGFRRNAAVTIIFGRWIPGLRFTVALSAGAVGIAYRRFVVYDLVGGSAWAMQNALLGFYLGRAFGEEVLLGVGLSVVVAVAVGVVIGIAEARRRARRAPSGDPPGR